MVEDIRKNLDKVTGELLESFVKFDKSKVLHFQTGLHVLHKAEKDSPYKKTNLYAVCDHHLLERLLAEHGISKYDFDQVPQIIKDFESGRTDAYDTLRKLPDLLQEAVHKVNERNRAVYDVPAMGMIAVNLSLISNDIKNALLAGQSGEKTLQAAERIDGLVFHSIASSNNKDKILQDRLYDFGGNTRLARPYIDLHADEPGYLIAAKAGHHLADLLEGAVLLDKNLASENDIKKSVEAFKIISATIFDKSSAELHRHGEENAGEKIKDVAQHVRGRVGEDYQGKAAIANAENGLKMACKTLFELAIFDEKEKEDFNILTEKRINQLKLAEEIEV